MPGDEGPCGQLACTVLVSDAKELPHLLCMRASPDSRGPGGGGGGWGGWRRSVAASSECIADRRPAQPPVGRPRIFWRRLEPQHPRRASAAARARLMPTRAARKFGSTGMVSRCGPTRLCEPTLLWLVLWESISRCISSITPRPRLAEHAEAGLSIAIGSVRCPAKQCAYGAPQFHFSFCAWSVL